MDRLEADVEEEGLVGADLVEAVAVGGPLAAAVLEDGGGEGGGIVGEGGRVEVDADEGHQASCLSVAGPVDAVVPVGVVPVESGLWVVLVQPREEPGLEALALESEEFAGALEVDFLADFAEGPAKNEPGEPEAGRQNRDRDDESGHVGGLAEGGG